MAKRRKGNLPSGSYRVRVNVGIMANGKHRYESFTSADPDEAEEAAAAFRRKVKRMLAAGIAVEDIPREDVPVKPRDTVQEYLDRYLDTCRVTGLSPSTLQSYRRIIARAYSGIKELRIDKLTISLIQDYANRRIAAGATAKTVRCELSLLPCALQTARPDLDMRLIRLPKQPRKEMQIPSTADVQRLLDEVRGTEMQLPVLMAAVMGLRRSEICGLKWDAVDLKRKTLHIHSAIVRGEEGTYMAKGTTTEAGDRVLPIPSNLIPVFRASRNLSPYVTELTPDAITRRYERLTARLGIPGRFHDLRHYHASVMIAAGAPDKYITADMGHSTMEMVRRVYGHVMGDRMQEINAAMEERAAAFSV